MCFISGYDNGLVYILNCDIPPSKVPPNVGSNKMFVVNADNEVPDKVLLGITSGSCWYVNPVKDVGQSASVKLSLNPCVPPPQDILNGTPNCFSFSVFNALGIISSNPLITKNNLPLTNIFNEPNLWFFSVNHFSFKFITSIFSGAEEP